MTQYIQMIQTQFLTVYNFPENPEKPGLPLGPFPEGTYPMKLEGKIDYVRIDKDGFIACCNWTKPEGVAFQKPRLAN